MRKLPFQGVVVVYSGYVLCNCLWQGIYDWRLYSALVGFVILLLMFVRFVYLFRKRRAKQ
jgi:membrane protein DedA with SNARE-associated domain